MSDMVGVGNNGVLPIISVDEVVFNEVTHENAGENEDERCQRLEEKLKELTKKYLTVTEVLEPVCLEFGQITEEIEVERECRLNAEKVAKKTQNENRRIKRHSMALLSQLQRMDVSLENLVEESEEVDAGKNADQIDLKQENKIIELETKNTNLSEKIGDLNRSNKEFKDKIDVMNIMNKNLQKEYEKSLLKIEESEKLISTYKTTSVLALKEYDKMNNDIESEVTLKEKAEDYARECLVAKRAMARQSTILMGSVGADERLRVALMQIEKVTFDFDVERKEFQNQVKELKKTIDVSEDLSTQDILKSQLETANLEVENLRKHIVQLEELKKNEEAKKCNNDSHPLLDHPAPPQPPPLLPPPTPLAPLILKPRSKVHSSSSSSSMNSSLHSPEVSKQDQLIEEMKKMMQRINKGPKAPSSTMKKKEPRPLPAAMKELMEITKSAKWMKKAGSQTVRPSSSKTIYEEEDKKKNNNNNFNVIRRRVSPPEKNNNCSSVHNKMSSNALQGDIPTTSNGLQKEKTHNPDMTNNSESSVSPGSTLDNICNYNNTNNEKINLNTTDINLNKKDVDKSFEINNKINMNKIENCNNKSIVSNNNTISDKEHNKTDFYEINNKTATTSILGTSSNNHNDNTNNNSESINKAVNNVRRIPNIRSHRKAPGPPFKK